MNDDQRRLIEAELVDLRGELHDLKSCQVEFLKLAATATGAIFALWGTFVRGGSETGSAPATITIAPLLIVLPTWWVFFDKATTITRIVGYKRVLEGFLLGRYPTANYLGWESSLSLFRRGEGSGPSAVPRPLGPRSRWLRHRYWLIAYSTFLLLSIACLSVAWAQPPCQPSGSAVRWLLLPAALIAFSAWSTLIQLSRLISGRNSYDFNEARWMVILGVTDATGAAVTGTPDRPASSPT